MDQELNEDGEVQGTQNETKLSRMEEIANAAENARADEMQDIDGDEVVPQPEPERVPDPEPIKLVTLKINGQDKEVTLEEALRLAQKVAAGDDYLAQSKRLFEQLKTQPSPDVVTQQPDENQENLELARLLQTGDQATIADVVRKLRSATPSINLDELTMKAVDKMRYEEDSQWFKNEYKDIFDDPDLFQLAVHRDTAMVQAQDSRPYKERYREIGDSIRAKFGKSMSPMEVKQQRKAATVSVLPTASARSSSEKAEEPDDTPSTVIANMAKQRGQQM